MRWKRRAEKKGREGAERKESKQNHVDAPCLLEEASHKRHKNQPIDSVLDI